MDILENICYGEKKKSEVHQPLVLFLLLNSSKIKHNIIYSIILYINPRV